MGLFDKFKTKTKKVKIKSLDDAQVEIREITISEANEFVGKITKDGVEDFVVDQQKYREAKLDIISSCVIKPEITVEELKELSSGATEAIEELYQAINGLSEEGKTSK